MTQKSNKLLLIEDNDIEKIKINNEEIVLYFSDKNNIESSDIIKKINNKSNNKFIVVYKDLKIGKYNIKINTKLTKFFINRKKDTNFLIIIDITDNFNYLKKTIKAIKNIFDNTNSLIRCFIIDNSSTYEKDVINCLKAISIIDKPKKYEFIYDTVCDELDEKFKKCNHCDFKNGKCIANRNKANLHGKMGCCYSFEYRSIFDIRFIKNLKLCEYIGEKGCLNKNISCKLFTCNYLKNKGIRYDIHDFLLLECFLDKKQKDVIQFNFFRTKEQILKKLQEKNNDIYYFYILFRKYLIEKDYNFHSLKKIKNSKSE